MLSMRQHLCKPRNWRPLGAIWQRCKVTTKTADLLERPALCVDSGLRSGSGSPVAGASEQGCGHCLPILPKVAGEGAGGERAVSRET